MTVTLTVTAGPHAGKEFVFDRHDTFLVGRSRDAHFRLSAADPYFSRRHFLVEVNPPRVRVLDLNSRNGIAVNGQKVKAGSVLICSATDIWHEKQRGARIRFSPLACC